MSEADRLLLQDALLDIKLLDAAAPHHASRSSQPLAESAKYRQLSPRGDAGPSFAMMPPYQESSLAWQVVYSCLTRAGRVRRTKQDHEAARCDEACCLGSTSRSACTPN